MRRGFLAGESGGRTKNGGAYNPFRAFDNQLTSQLLKDNAKTSGDAFDKALLGRPATSTSRTKTTNNARKRQRGARGGSFGGGNRSQRAADPRRRGTTSQASTSSSTSRQPPKYTKEKPMAGACKHCKTNGLNWWSHTTVACGIFDKEGKRKKRKTQ
jgi:hypothetical protein